MLLFYYAYTSLSSVNNSDNIEKSAGTVQIAVYIFHEIVKSPCINKKVKGNVREI